VIEIRGLTFSASVSTDGGVPVRLRDTEARQRVESLLQFHT
jgi:hypothetical protein